MSAPTPSMSSRRVPAARSLTWPPTTGRLRAAAVIHGRKAAAQMSAPSASTPATMPRTTTNTRTTTPQRSKPIFDLYEDEINQNPADHFLSPVQMYGYDDWASDSDSDADDVEWDAGITDFALFDSDRRQAQKNRQQVSGRWDPLLASQASALQRAVQRNRSDSDPTRSRKWTPLIQDLPQLTPDNSPTLRDRFDIHAHCGGKQPPRRNSIPDYLKQQVTPPEEETSDEDDVYEDDDSDDDELPVAFLVKRARERRRQARTLERPGMRFNRTMSGKIHVWTRPSYHIYDVGEEPEAEKRAELASGKEREVQESGRRPQQSLSQLRGRGR